MASDLFAHETEERQRREIEISASWEKRVLHAGRGDQIAPASRVTLHLDARLHSPNGPLLESTRERGVPLILLALRGTLVPGLDSALLSCRQAERAVVTVKPSGAYGNRGYVDANGVRKVPGDCTLVYEIEVLQVEEEVELWMMDFTTKMRHAQLAPPPTSILN